MSYTGWVAGHPIGAGLPQPPGAYSQALFSPGQPISPYPVNAPVDGRDRPMPRRFQYPVTWNLPLAQPGNEGLKLAPFGVLRQLADIYSVARACVELRKKEILAQDWDIVPTEAAAKAMRGDAAMMADFLERRDAAAAFFRNPDRNYDTFHSWLAALLEEMFVTDAMCLYLHPATVAGKGLLGSDVAALDIIDGTTIRPLLDVYGARPAYPAPAYQQFIWGVPRCDLASVLSDRDLDAYEEQYGEAPVAIREYAGDQLLYRPHVTRTWTPYGFPAVERAIIPLITGLKRQEYWLDYYKSGSIPGMFVMGGKDIDTPAKARQLQEILNAVGGDMTFKHKIVVLPFGSDAKAAQQAGLSDSYDDTLNEQITMAFDVQPMELGLSPAGKKSAMGGKGMADASENTNDRKALKPDLMFLKRNIFDYLLQRICKQQDMEFQFAGLAPVEDQAAQTAMLVSQVNAAIRTRDEARQLLGLDPFGLPLTSDPVVMLPTGPLDLGSDEAANVTPTPPAGPATTPPPQGPAAASPLHDAEAATAETSPGGEAAKPLDVKAAQAELRAFANFARNGRRPLDSFAFDALPDTLVTKLLAGESVAEVRKRVAAVQHGQKRHEALTAIMTTTALKLARLAKQQHGHGAFTNAATAILAGAYGDAYLTGAQAADPAADLTEDEVSEAVAPHVQHQQPFIQKLALDVGAGMATQALAQRMALYGRSARPVYERGYGDTTVKLAGDNPPSITWHATAADPCDLCAERDGKQFTPQSLPGYPGDGGFGPTADICEGGPNCRCELTYGAGQ